MLAGCACEGGVRAGRGLAKADVRVRAEAVASAATGADAREGRRIAAALREAPAPDALDLVRLQVDEVALLVEYVDAVVEAEVEVEVLVLGHQHRRGVLLDAADRPDAPDHARVLVVDKDLAGGVVYVPVGRISVRGVHRVLSPLGSLSLSPSRTYTCIRLYIVALEAVRLQDDVLGEDAELLRRACRLPRERLDVAVHGGGAERRLTLHVLHAAAV